MMKYILIIAFLLIGCEGDLMSKIGKSQSMKMISSNVVDTESYEEFDKNMFYKDGTRVVKDNFIYIVTPDTSEECGRVATYCNDTPNNPILRYGTLIGDWDGKSNLVSIVCGAGSSPQTGCFEWAITKDEQKSVFGEFTYFDVVKTRKSLDGAGDCGDTAHTSNKTWKIFSSYDKADNRIGDISDSTLFVEDGKLYFKQSGASLMNARYKYDLEKVKPVNKMLAFDGISSTPTTAPNTMTTTAKALKPFNSIMFSNVIGESLTYEIKDTASTVIKSGTIPIDCWILDDDGNQWEEVARPVLILMDGLTPKGYTITYTITNIGTVELGEIVTSHLKTDGGTILGGEKSFSTPQEDKINAVGQVDRAKSILPIIVKYTIWTKKDKISELGDVHKVLYNEEVVILPTGKESSELPNALLQPMVAWLKKVPIIDDGTIEPTRTIMELREKI